MSKKKKTARRSGSCRPLSPGDAAYLRADLPAGLLESESGNKYIITAAPGFPIAIALHHRQLKPFTWLPLCNEELEKGKWIGPYRLRLRNSLPGPSSPREPGNLGMFGDHAILDCRSVVGVEG